MSRSGNGCRRRSDRRHGRRRRRHGRRRRRHSRRRRSRLGGFGRGREGKRLCARLCAAGRVHRHGLIGDNVGRGQRWRRARFRRLGALVRAAERRAGDHVLRGTFDQLGSGWLRLSEQGRGCHARRGPRRGLGDERIKQDTADCALERRRDGKDRRRRRAHRAGDLGVRPRIGLSVGRAQTFAETLGVSRRESLGHRDRANTAGGTDKTTDGCAHGTTKRATCCRAGSAPTEPRRNDRSRATDAAAQIIHKAPIIGRRRGVGIGGEGLPCRRPHGVADRLLGPNADALEQIRERSRLGWIGWRRCPAETPDTGAGRR